MLTAAVIVLGGVILVHSIGGEVLLFRTQARWTGLPVALGSDSLAKQTLRATWHVASVFGIAFAAVLHRFSGQSALAAGEGFVLDAIAAALVAGGVVVLIMSRARHPGWAGLSLAGALVWLA